MYFLIRNEKEKAKYPVRHTERQSRARPFHQNDFREGNIFTLAFMPFIRPFLVPLIPLLFSLPLFILLPYIARVFLRLHSDHPFPRFVCVSVRLFRFTSRIPRLKGNIAEMTYFSRRDYQYTYQMKITRATINNGQLYFIAVFVVRP